MQGLRENIADSFMLCASSGAFFVSRQNSGSQNAQLVMSTTLSPQMLIPILAFHWVSVLKDDGACNRGEGAYYARRFARSIKAKPPCSEVAREGAKAVCQRRVSCSRNQEIQNQDIRYFWLTAGLRPRANKISAGQPAQYGSSRVAVSCCYGPMPQISQA